MEELHIVLDIDGRYAGNLYNARTKCSASEFQTLSYGYYTGIFLQTRSDIQEKSWITPSDTGKSSLDNIS
nr:unnamed protein product [Haemonchus contortus]